MRPTGAKRGRKRESGGTCETSSWRRRLAQAESRWKRGPSLETDERPGRSGGGAVVFGVGRGRLGCGGGRGGFDGEGGRGVHEAEEATAEAGFGAGGGAHRVGIDGASGTIR